MAEKEYIGREACMQALCDASTPIICEGRPTFAVNYIKAVGSVPAADVRPIMRGKWIVPVPGDGDPYCQVCKRDALSVGIGFRSRPVLTDFCPFCGADLREEAL